MKAQLIEQIVQSTIHRLPEEKIQDLRQQTRDKKPPDLVPQTRMVLRETRLAEAETRPSRVDFERILGTNDLVDVNYLTRALRAARSVCRVVLRDRAGREIGYGTGFKVSPSLVMTNHHVLESAADAETAVAEFDYELDQWGHPRATTRFTLDPAAFFLNDLELDFTLVAISPRPFHGTGSLGSYGFLRMIPEVGKINPGEAVTIIQHPSGQPKQVALRENDLLSIEELVLWYQSDTAQGSSGSPVFNDSWQLVALHHSGVPRTDDRGNWLLKTGEPAGPDAEDGEIDWIANEGIRASRIVHFVEGSSDRRPHRDEFLRAASGEIEAAFRLDANGGLPSAVPAMGVEPVPGVARVTVPVSLTITVDGIVASTPGRSQAVHPDGEAKAPPPDAVERMKLPFVDTDYSKRKGYDSHFLGVEVPLPKVRRKSWVAKMDNGDHALPYEHFSLVMDKRRRMALFTASNVDARPDKKRPEPGRDYTRDGLGGFGPNDIEMWLTDPRIPEQHQLPDRFYTRDGGAFDKGHLVRRDDVTWGNSYAEVQRANGDSYHTTNCSPQVADFNRSSKDGIWGKLENYILKQAKTETYCVFSGPVLRSDDREFVGRDHRGEVRIQIPSEYWKVVIARADDELQAFAFMMEQDLTDVTLEFAMTDEWENYMVAIGDLEDEIGNIRFPAKVKHADQFETQIGNELFGAEELAGLRRKEHARRPAVRRERPRRRRATVRV